MSTARTMMAMLLCVCLILPCLAGEQIGSGDQRRSFILPQHGVLTLNVPRSWKQVVRQPPGGLPPTITLSPDKGDEFKVLITPLWSPKKEPAFNKSEKVRALIDNDLRSMLPTATEKQVVIQPFDGVYGTGYYFLVTDKAPKPGDYPYAVRAGVGVGDLLLSVTILSRSKSSEGIAATVQALRQARQI